MAGLRRTGWILAIVLIPWLITGCAATNSRLTKLSSRTAEDQEQIWAQAQLNEKNGRYSEAQQLYAELCRRDPQSARYAHRLGVAATMAGAHERAAAAYARARELNPNDADLLADMGYAAYLSQHYAESESLLRASLAAADDNPRAMSNLALAVGLQGRYDECLELFRQVHGQDEAEVLCNLAYVKSQRGDDDEARALYQQVLAIDPQVTKATVALAALKAAETKAQTVAQQKPYRKYMNQNAPTVAKSQPEAEPVAKASAVLKAEPAKTDVTLASQAEEQAQDLAEDDDQSLTGWTETEENPDTTPTASATTRAFPEETSADPALPTEQPAALMPVEVQSVSTDESPFAIAEESATATVTAVIPDDVDQAFKEPEDATDGWAASGSDQAETLEAEWLNSRLEQIAARHDQPGFMGFCPVALRDEQKLIDALPQYTAEYQSQHYQFCSEDAVKKFEAEPERYLPAAGGLDVVAVSQGTAVAQGSLEHALWFRHKLYLFLTRENLEVFRTQARQFAVQQ